MRLVASDIYSLYCPSPCPRRVFLRAKGVKEVPPGPYDQVIQRLGQEHEKACLAKLPAAVDLSSGSPQEREARTKAEIARGTSVIYQGRLSANAVLGGVDCEIVGEPDFLISAGPGKCIVDDAKMARQITEKDHPEILLLISPALDRNATVGFRCVKDSEIAK